MARTPPSQKKIAVVGAGVGGLVAAAELARTGMDVTIFESAAAPGGKMRSVAVGGALVDAGPTVFTMRDIFEELFDVCGESLDDALPMRPLETLARYAWSGNDRLDLFADIDRSADAISAFAGPAEGAGFRRFCDSARRTFQALDHPFMRRQRPSLPMLMARSRPEDLIQLTRINPFSDLWSALGEHFSDPRLRQIFARYATYCGSSPFKSPATLMLIAHVEQQGVWQVEGGMQALADALAALAKRCGAKLICGSHIGEIGIRNGRADSVTLRNGERFDADAVLVNADASALGSGLFGQPASLAVAPIAAEERSLSALTWALVAETDGFALARHNVFLSSDYAAEFADIFARGTLPQAPTVYVCAQDRADATVGAERRSERLLCIVNAPPRGDMRVISEEEISQCETSTFGFLKRCGLSIRRDPAASVVTTPADFARLYPGTGGALYGRASHGWRASFQRPGSRTRIAGLYLAGGSVHPGAGVPMAALSGRLAAQSMITDLASTGRSRKTAMRGGMSMR